MHGRDDPYAGFHEQEEVAAWQEERRESKYARDLAVESSEGRKIPPDSKKWKCAETGATENLWLNLSDGHIGSGRQHWDGSGGNGSALRHYQAMKAEGKEYPLVVGFVLVSSTVCQDRRLFTPKLSALTRLFQASHHQ